VVDIHDTRIRNIRYHMTGRKSSCRHLQAPLCRFSEYGAIYKCYNVLAYLGYLSQRFIIHRLQWMSTYLWEHTWK